MLKKNSYKIGVNGRFLTQKFSGIGRYSISLFAELAKDYPDFSFKIVVPEKPDAQIMAIFKAFKNVEIVIILEKKILKKTSLGLAKSYWEKFQLAKYFQKEKVNLIHLPYPALLKRIKNIPLVVTVHDAIPWTLSDYKNTSWLSKKYNQAVLKIAAQAEQVLTVSKYSQREILKLRKIAAEKIEVVYNACNYSKNLEVKKAEQRKVLEKYSIDPAKNYLFYMGGYDKRKNVARLIEIYQQEVINHSDIQLVLGGAKILENKLFEELKLLKNNSILKPSIIKTGFIDEEDLPILYKSAQAFISLSKSEGFNLNLLEALTLKTPAIVSDLEVHREIAGQTAYFVKLNDSNKQIGQEIVNLLNQKDKYNEIKSRAEQFVSLFSWKKAAKEVKVIYLKIINKAKNAI